MDEFHSLAAERAAFQYERALRNSGLDGPGTTGGSDTVRNVVRSGVNRNRAIAKNIARNNFKVCGG